MKAVEIVRAWLESETHFPECLLPDNVEEHRARKMERLETGEKLRIFEQAGQFIVWETGLSMDTGQSLAQVWGWRSEGDGLDALFKESLAELSCDMFLFNRSPDSVPEPALLESFGFGLYRRRFVLWPRERDLNTPRMTGLRLRAASELDRGAVCSIATNQVAYTLPADFSHELERVIQFTLDRYRRLELGDDSAFDLLLAEEKATLRPCGYILLSAGEPGTVYLDDLAVKKEYWGNYVGHFMVRSVENLLIENGLKLLYADISEANRRSHMTATRQLGFVPNLEYWLKKS